MINGDGRLVSSREHSGKPHIDNPTCFTFRPPCWVRRVRWGKWVKHLTECRMLKFSLFFFFFLHPLPQPLPFESKHQKQFASSSRSSSSYLYLLLLRWGGFVLSGKKIRPCVEQLARNCNCATLPLITQAVVGHVARFHYFYVYAHVSSAASLSVGWCRTQRAELQADAKKRESADPLTDTVNWIYHPTSSNGVFSTSLTSSRTCFSNPTVLKFSLTSPFPALIQAIVRKPPSKEVLPVRVGKSEVFTELIWKNSESLGAWFFWNAMHTQPKS